MTNTRLLILAGLFGYYYAASGQTIAIGEAHGIALCADGTVTTWGWNLKGQLGLGFTTSGGTCQCLVHPSLVEDLYGVVAVAAGRSHTTVLLSDGTVRIWGAGEAGQLGVGVLPGDTCACESSPQEPSGLPPIRSIAVGGDHSLALALDSTVWSWGKNNYGQLGNGTFSTGFAPVQVSGLTGIVAIGCGVDHSFAIRSDGTAWAWGRNETRQLGDGTYTHRPAPVQVLNLNDAVSISGGVGESLALKSDGSVWIWNIGGGPVPFLDEVGAIAAGSYHFAALKNDGTVWSWGLATSGQIGNGTNNLVAHDPTQAIGLTGVTELSAGGQSTFALSADDVAFSWGSNSNGQLCDNTLLGRNTPTLSDTLCTAPIALGYVDVHDRRCVIISNPFGEHFIISHPTAKSFRVYSLAGAELASGLIQNGIAEVSITGSGLYLLELRGPRNERTVLRIANL